MTTDETTTTPPRPGSGQDLSRRMDKMEQRHEDLAREVNHLSATVARVEQNQEHSTELNRLRFDALDSGMKSLAGQLTDFMKRIEGIMEGTIQTAAMKSGQEMVVDYKSWRESVDERLDDQAVLNGQIRLLGRLVTILVGSNALTLIGAIAYFVASGGR